MKIGVAIQQGVKTVAKEWTSAKRKEIRDADRGARAFERYYRGHLREDSIKTIAYRVMATAYAKASGDGQFPATARQVMYAARPLILAETDKTLGKDFDVYFTQKLLPDYQREHPAATANWDVVYDARGHLYEPHTGSELALGTLDVRTYLTKARAGADATIRSAPRSLDYPTQGPFLRYTTVLFLEKEGFIPLLRQAEVSERYDLAIMSTKGMASTAGRTLVERLSLEHDVRFLVLHDFDKAGFSICATLTQNTDRYRFRHRPNVEDLGLRLADIEVEGLEAEPCTYHERDPAVNLERNGATNDEIDFLLADGGQRVELNAFASDQFVTWLESKLEKVGVEKLIPDDETLAAAYRRAVYVQALNAEMEKLHETAEAVATAAVVPDNLRDAIQSQFDEDDTRSWDAAIADLATEADGKE